MQYFVAVAEELHFSRAAARVFLSQQALSRQIKELEEQVGAQLFDRTTRKVILTSAGEAFLDGARLALRALAEAVAMAQQADRAMAGVLRLGFAPGAALELTSPILEEFSLRCPDVAIEMREFSASDPSAGMASRASDVAFLRLPQDTKNIETEPLFADPVVAMVSATHALATRTSVTASELVDEPITVSDTPDDIYRAFWRLDNARASSVPAQVVPISSVTEELSLVAAGRAMAITSAATMRYAPIPGIRALTIKDWPASIVSVAWHRGERSLIVARFVAAARTVCDRETETVRRIEAGRI
ncbi:LysR family transcriptional regulator [Mycobacteroides abscessus]|uniref:LysR substrate-binding domain-containing protein n=1 Tax=Mycobacteroides abscessus TaxID=36809 RepID=UPI0009A5BB25|nr:LysR substrate-binding domain-containing protein [Mycobacteroides abscessus]